MVKTHTHVGIRGGWCDECGMHYLHESHTFEEIKYENTCGVEGCFAAHKVRPSVIRCTCKGKYVCWKHREARQTGHQFPVCSTPPSFCRMPRCSPCVNPYCDCGMQES